MEIRMAIFVFILVIFLPSLNGHDVEYFAIGPGIDDPELVFGSRYFFLFHKQRNLPAKSVRIRSKTSRSCRIWPQVFNETQFCIWIDNSFDDDSIKDLETLLDRFPKFCPDTNDDGSEPEKEIRYWMTIVRYAMLRDEQECREPLELVVMDSNSDLVFQKDIGTTSIILYSEFCQCPRNDWSERMRCNSLANQKLQEQIDRDLQPFLELSFNFTEIREEAENRFAKYPQTYAYCWYKIIENRAYKRCYGQYVGFSKFFDQMLLSLMRKTRLEDNQFLVNLGDWPLSDRHHRALPIFSWCGSYDTNDLVLPTYELTESILESQGRQTVDILSVFGRQPLPFKEKLNKLFWRGRDSNRARLRLVEHSFDRPDLYDVAITNFFFFRDEMHRYRKSEQKNQTYVSFLEFFRYKYQINIDGTVAAYRFPFLLAGNSLVLKQKSLFYEFFYQTILAEDQHYLSVAENLDDLPGLLDQLITGSKDVSKIIWNARRIVLRYLLPVNVYCYYFTALERYRSQLLLSTKEIPILDGTEEPVVPESTVPTTPCHCDTPTGGSKDEL